MARRDDRSTAAVEYRKRYKTARWQAIRRAQFAAHPLCHMCKPTIVAATVCDHVDKASKSTEEGFFAGPFQSLCKTHHDSTRQREERRGHLIGCDDDGLPLDPRHHWNQG